MDMIRELYQSMMKYIALARYADIFDVLIVAFVVFQLLQLVRRSNAMRVLKGILLILAVMVLAQLFELYALTWLLQSTLQVGLLALVIVFQPELRKMLEQMGSSKLTNFLGHAPVGEWETAIAQTVEACSALSWAREGALIVFERRVLLRDIVKTGTVVNSDVSSELLKNIFYPKAPLHDGAVIIQDARIMGAGCMLPLTTNANLSKDLGMRHRAGIGMSENADAVVVIVSEETGSISVAIEGMLKRHLAPETLETLLRIELLSENDDDSNNVKGAKKFFRRFKGQKHG